MKKIPFTNIHTHIFNTDCAPDRFLMVIPSAFIRKHAKRIKNGLDAKISYKILNGLGKFLSKRATLKRGMFDKTIAFLDIGTEKEQSDIFNIAFETEKKYDANARLIALSLDMDHMDSFPSEKMKPFRTQLEELKNLKRYYPDQLFLFLGIDPRNKKGNELLNWAKSYLEHGTEKNGINFPFFCGIKLYPALGFFPFDPALDELYAYCESKRIPIITHCTRVGSMYIGENIEQLIPDEPNMILPENNSSAEHARKEIIERIQRYRKKGWIKNNEKAENDLACDLFCHPQNYIPILEKYPNLKICLAHLGGANEIKNANHEKTLGIELSEIRKTDGYNWFDSIKNYLVEYPNLYSDISYTLSEFKDQLVLEKIIALMETKDKQHTELGNRILFGTDFFMTEQENKESELYLIAQATLGKWFEKISRENNQRFLCQPLPENTSN